MILSAAWLAMRSSQVLKLASPRKPFRFSSALKKVCCVTSSRLVSWRNIRSAREYTFCSLTAG